MEVSQLQEAISKHEREFYRLNTMRDHFIGEKASCISKIEGSQAYLDNRDEVLDVLNELHQRTQVRTKEVYEQLLTTLVQEIKPGDPENEKVVLETEIRRNRTSLEVGMKNDKGHIRNVYLDKGGSVENIIAMGLRFIAVSRTSNRRLIVMDEADSALRSEYIPIFAAIMDQLARQIGMQVIYISHHPVSCFEGKARIIHLERQDGYVTAEQVSDVAKSGNKEIQEKLGSELNEDEDMMEGVGLRYIRLVNVKQHENTMIELSPYVNVITADVDVGKSTVVQAIEALSHNLGREGLIRDGQPSARVEIGLEDGMTLQWSYARRGTKKTNYKLTNSDNKEVQTSDSGTEVPAWLHDYLGMEKHQDFDLHISDQHNSSFILDKRISGFRRAELLSLGKEATQVQKMITQHGEKADRCRRIVNENKKKLLEVKNKLAALRSIGSIEERLVDLRSLAKSIESSSTNNTWLKSNIELITKCEGKIAALSPIVSIALPSKKEINDLSGIRIQSVSIIAKEKRLALLSSVASIEIPNKPKVKDLSGFLELGRGIGKATQKIEALSSIQDLVAPKKPKLSDTNAMGLIYHRLEKINAVSKVMENLDFEIPKKPTVSDLSAYAETGKSISLKGKAAQDISTKIKEAEKELSECIIEKDGVITSLGGVCPVCKGSIKCKGEQHEK